MALTTEIPSDVAALLHTGDGIIDVKAAIAAGLSEGRLAAMAAGGTLVRLAEGCYAERADFDQASRWEQFRLRSIAFVASCGPHTYLAGWSAVRVWGLPTLGRPPALPDVIRPKRAGRGPSVTTTGRTRVAKLPNDHMLLLGDDGRRKVPIMSCAWTVADLVRDAPVVDALVLADAALHCGEPLLDLAAHFQGWDGAGRMRWVLKHANGAAETPLESLGRFACIEFKLPMPVANAWVGCDGPERRVDELWPWHWVAGEGDGALKYDNKPDASSVVSKQNEREWQLRRLGLDFVRYGWSIAFHRRAELAAKFAAVLRDNPPRDQPIRWWKNVPGVGPVDPEPCDIPSPQPSSIILPAGWRSARV